MDRCENCGVETPIELLDAKPAPGKWTEERLRRAADAGLDFNRLEGPCCYGPGYQAGSK